jgi:hypothetical protein
MWLCAAAWIKPGKYANFFCVSLIEWRDLSLLRFGGSATGQVSI